jgi:uncharacterized protein (DUF1684 family)
VINLTLIDYRRRVAAMYAGVRAGSGVEAFREARAELFATHPDTPLVDGHAPPVYWPYDPSFRFGPVEVDTDVDATELPIVRSDGSVADTFVRIGRLHLPIGDLDVWWLDAYGGGVFVPFRDATNGVTTYGGGRYLLDTAKGADLGSTPSHLVIDCNYAYHPSCFYSPRWACPLAPPTNVLTVEVRAGERAGPS